MSTIFIYIYSLLHEDEFDKELIKKLFQARFLETIYYLLAFYRGSIPDIFSVNISNSLMFVSLYINGYLLLVLSNNDDKKQIFCLRGILVSSLILFNLADLSLAYDLRAIISSICMIAIVTVPSYKLIFSKNAKSITHIVGSVYVLVLLVSSFRTIYTFITPVQTITLLVQYLSVMFTTPAMMLIVKDRTDKKLQQLALVDGLTGIPNRISFLKETQRYFTENRNAEQEISILFLDIDFFKRVNDTYGHAFGDEVLIAFAAVLEKNTRKNDMSCRYGGEEFLIVMMNSSEATSVKVAERIMTQVRELRFESQPDFNFTVSIGIYSGIVEYGSKLDLYIEKADKAMYVAKNSGRDKIVVYSSKFE